MSASQSHFDPTRGASRKSFPLNTLHSLGSRSWPAVLLSMLLTGGAFGQTNVSTATNAAATRTPDVIFVPTRQTVIDKMLALAEIKTNDILYDLGCGDGRIV